VPLEPQEFQPSAGPPEFVRALLAEGLRRGASDIHVEPASDHVRIRLRVDGVLEEAARWPRAWHDGVLARLKVLANLLTYRTDIPQEGRIRSDHHDDPTDLRLSTFPTIFGEKAVIRIFDPRRGIRDLDELGFAPDIRAELERWTALPSGVLIITGPTGSGKTTTIYALLRRIARASGAARNIVSIEDPVEHAIEGVVQTQVHPHSGFTFATALRSLLRQDPDVIVVGEVRDSETARIAIQAGLTGRLVITTLHAGRASAAFARLVNLGVDSHEVASSVAGVLAQRLLRARAGGRIPVAEVLRPGRAIRAAVLNRADAEDLEQRARADGLVPIHDAADAAVRAGLVAPEEVLRVLGPREPP
jgi:type II secretory ATPase GspE/PulE/Tfp pilus assembly ATPase PilB-like protein